MGLISWIFGKKKKVEFEIPNQNYEVAELFDSLTINKTDLELHKIEETSEVLINYLGGILSDVGKIGTIKDEELSFVFSRIKKTSEHGMELENLVEQLLSYYYDPVLSVLDQVRDNYGYEINVDSLEIASENLKSLASELKSFVIYYKLLNPDERELKAILKDFKTKKVKDAFMKTIRNSKDLIEKAIMDSHLRIKLDVDILQKIKDEVLA